MKRSSVEAVWHFIQQRTRKGRGADAHVCRGEANLDACVKDNKSDLDTSVDTARLWACATSRLGNLIKAAFRPEPLGMAMPGALLPQRIRHLLNGSFPRTSRLRMIAVCVASTILAATFSTGSLIHAQRPQTSAVPTPQPAAEPQISTVSVHADATPSQIKTPILLAQAAPPSLKPTVVKPLASLEFEVASVRPADPKAFLNRSISGGRYTAENLTLRQLIEDAYDLKQFQLTGGPSWLSSDKFTVIGKGPETATEADIRILLRALLASRFQLVLRGETREQTVYVLTVKDSSKLQSAKEGGKFQYKTSTSGESGETINHVAFKNTTMERFTDLLSRNMQRPVQDQTGLAGEFDFEFDAVHRKEELNPFMTDWAPALPQAGLKLDSEKGPVQFFIVDRAEKPSEN